MAREDERFLARWSRLKREQVSETAQPVAPESTPHPAEPGAPALPPVEALTPESDFSVFMGPQVADALRRAALKKLFRHPEIGIPDPYEPFSGDWTGGEKISEEMLKTLYQANRKIARAAESQPAEPQPAESRPQAPAGHEENPAAEARVAQRGEDA